MEVFFFCHRKKKSKQPSQRNKIFLFFTRKNFTLHQTRLLKAMRYRLANPLSQNKIAFRREAPKIFFCKDYPYGYPEHMRYCPELTKSAYPWRVWCKIFVRNFENLEGGDPPNDTGIFYNKRKKMILKYYPRLQKHHHQFPIKIHLKYRHLNQKPIHIFPLRFLPIVYLSHKHMLLLNKQKKLIKMYWSSEAFFRSFFFFCWKKINYNKIERKRC